MAKILLLCFVLLYFLSFSFFLMLSLIKFAAWGSGCIIMPELLNQKEQSPPSSPHFYVFLLSLTSNRKPIESRREPTEKGQEEGSWRRKGRADVTRGERRDTRWMSALGERRGESLYFFSIKSTCIRKEFCTTKTTVVWVDKRAPRCSWLHFPCWSYWICTQMSSCLPGRLSLSPKKLDHAVIQPNFIHRNI